MRKIRECKYYEDKMDKIEGFWGFCSLDGIFCPYDYEEREKECSKFKEKE